MTIIRSPCLILQLVLSEQLVAAKAPEELPLDGGKVVEGRREEDVLVAGGCCDFIQLRHVGSVDADGQDADAWEVERKTMISEEIWGFCYLGW